MKSLINYMRMAVMNTEGKEQEKCLAILRILERKAKRRRIAKKVNTVLYYALTVIALALLFVGVATIREDFVPSFIMISGSLPWLTLVSWF